MKFDVVRAWKDEAYRCSLSAEEQAQLPENPAGSYELSDADMEGIYGGQVCPPNVHANQSQYGSCSNALVCKQSAFANNNYACFSNGFGADCNNVNTKTASGTGNILGSLIGTGGLLG
ncbi:MAG: mersacidin/lichenicidin family type 2 lantibiotic [Ktedonobacteraceae bacterium]|nr:mersacidin/lichenicidin family type 2 lantibiotic [Ktedonobacteraceae bacterium]